MTCYATHVSENVPKKRPWYLILALVLCTSFGACGWLDGYQSVLFYRDTSVDVPSYVEALPENAGRAHAREAAKALIDEREASRRKGFPLAVGTFVAGAAVLLFTMRTFANRATSKKLLVQFVALQTALIIAGHFVLWGVRSRISNVEDSSQEALAIAHAKTDADKVQIEQSAKLVYRIRPGIMRVQLSVRLMASLFVILALTRKRTREYFGEIESGVTRESGSSSNPNPPNG